MCMYIPQEDSVNGGFPARQARSCLKLIFKTSLVVFITDTNEIIKVLGIQYTVEQWGLKKKKIIKG